MRHKSGLEPDEGVEDAEEIEVAGNTLSFAAHHKRFAIGGRRSFVESYRQADNLAAAADL